MRTAYRNGIFFTADPDHRVLSDGLMIVEDRWIRYIGPFDEGAAQDADRTVDLGGIWVMPGLVNTHTHILMTILRGTGDDMRLQEWLQTRMFPLESRFDTETAAAGARLGILEMLKSGTTTISDMFNPVGIDADAVAYAVGETGITGAFSRAIFSFGSEREQKAGLIEADRFAKAYKTFADGRLTTMLTPHSAYAASPEALAESARIASENGLMVHIHAAENDDEAGTVLRLYGVRPVEQIRRTGIFGGPAVIAHGVVLNEEERQILAGHGVSVAHNPVSNLKLGSGIADVSRLLELGIKVGLGTDGAASNNNLDMFEEIRTAALLQKGLHKDATKLPARQALEMATRGGAAAIGMPQLGSLEAGKLANFITIRPHDKPHLQPLQEAFSHLVYSASGKDVCDVYIHGEPVVRNGECLTLDEERVIYEANRLRAKLS